MDLMEEINRHRGGEDSRTAIKRHHERHRDIEGRNLKKHFDLHAPVHGDLVTHALLPPNSLGASRGGAWRLPHSYVWWSSRTSFDPTYQRSMMGRSTPPSSYRSTPALSLRRAGMRP
jgi:hypothetical protein